MRNLNVSEARRELPSLIDDVALKGEKILITRRGRPVAQLAPCPRTRQEVNRHPLRGLPLRISDDFDKPLTDLWSALSL